MKRIVILLSVAIAVLFSLTTEAQQSDPKALHAADVQLQQVIDTLAREHYAGENTMAVDAFTEALIAGGYIDDVLLQQVCTGGIYTCRCDEGCWETDTTCGCGDPPPVE